MRDSRECCESCSLDRLKPQCGGFHLIVLQAADHELGENNDSGASDSGAAVNHDRRLRVLRGVQHAVGVTTHRLDLLQVR